MDQTSINILILSFSGYFNSTLNPIIYTIFSPEFRHAFKKLLCGRKYAAARRKNRHFGVRHFQWCRRRSDVSSAEPEFPAAAAAKLAAGVAAAASRNVTFRCDVRDEDWLGVAPYKNLYMKTGTSVYKSFIVIIKWDTRKQVLKQT